MIIRVGLIVLVLTMALSWACSHWIKTRRFEPVKMAVSLKEGENHATEFETNLLETYSVFFEMDYNNNLAPGGCSAADWGRVHWTVWRLSAGKVPRRRIWASSDDPRPPGWFIDGFHARPGKYRLEWSVPPEGVCLNALHARLTVTTDSENYEESVGLIQLVSALLGGAGIILILRGTGSLLLGSFNVGRPVRIFPELALRNVLPLRRHHPMPLIANLPIFVPVWICILTILVTMFAAMLMTPLMPRGFLVHFDKPRPTVWEKSPWKETMSVYVDGLREFYVNGRHVEPQDLQERLKKDLGERMVWAVYFEADDHARVSDAEYAMNTIQHLGAKLIWLTPKTRKELNQEGPK
jgi:biopolymer transport protein ExbD